MSRFYLIVSLLISFQGTLSALVDSTAIVMQNNWSESDKIRWLNNYSARMLAQDNPLFAQKSALNALKLSELTRFNFGIAKAEVHLGELAYNKNSYAEAEIHFQRAIRLFRTSGDKLNLSRAEAMNADACLMENKLDSALYFYKEALNQFNNGIIDDNLLSTIHKRTGDVYCRLDAIDKASNEYDNAIRVYSDIMKDNKKAGETAVNIGNILFGLNHRTEAIAYFDIGIRFFNLITDTAYVAAHIFSLSHILEASNETDLSINAAKKSLMIFTIRNDTVDIVENCAWLGWLNAKSKNNKSAYEYLDKAENLINRFSDKTAVLKNYGIIERSYEKLGDKEKSAKFYSLFVATSANVKIQNDLLSGKENILNYDEMQNDMALLSTDSTKNEFGYWQNSSQNFLRFAGIFIMLGTVILGGFQLFREKYKIFQPKSKVYARKIRQSLELEKEVVISKQDDTAETLTTKPDLKLPAKEKVLIENKNVKKINASPNEILNLISGHIEQIKRLQKELSDKKTDEKHHGSFNALKNCVYELQVLIESINDSMQLKESTILNTETFFAPNDVFNYVKEQTLVPPRISVVYNLDARLPSLLIGNGMRLSQIITQGIKGLSKPMIDGMVRVNLSRSEVIGDELTVKLDIESTGTGYIFDRLEKLINTAQPVNGTTDESESALLFVKKLIKSKNDDVFLHRTPQKIILTAFLTFEIPIPNYFSITNVHESLLPKSERPLKTNQ